MEDRKEGSLMDQEKIGRFIASCRKEQGMTQAVLAEKLGITDRAVSKWENGRSMPDLSIMQELCALLEIDVNELLSGERMRMDIQMEMERYRQMAQENLVQMQQMQEEANRRILRAEAVIVILTPAVLFFGVLLAFLVPGMSRRVFLLIVSATLFGLGVVAALRIEQTTGYYECPACGERYRPTLWAVFVAPHMGRTRKLTCPSCGERHYQKKVLTRREE